MATASKRVRKIAPLELAQLKKLAKPLTAAFERLQDAQLDTLVKKHRVRDGEQINPETGVIEKVGGKK